MNTICIGKNADSQKKLNNTRITVVMSILYLFDILIIYLAVFVHFLQFHQLKAIMCCVLCICTCIYVTSLYHLVHLVLYLRCHYAIFWFCLMLPTLFPPFGYIQFSVVQILLCYFDVFFYLEHASLCLSIKYKNIIYFTLLSGLC